MTILRNHIILDDKILDANDYKLGEIVSTTKNYQYIVGTKKNFTKVWIEYPLQRIY